MAGKAATKNNPNSGKTPTTEKIAVLTGAAKDDFLASAVTGLNEDAVGTQTLNVLANDPGSAWLYSLSQTLVASADQVDVSVQSLQLSSGAVVAIQGGALVINMEQASQGLQSLALGQVATETFHYVIRMANGALSTAQAVVEIAGLNDAPTLKAVDPVLILDTPAPAPATAVLQVGQLFAHDDDYGHVLTFSLLDAPTAIDNGDGTVSVSTDYGTFTLNTQLGSYSFEADAAALDALEQGQQHSALFTVQVADEHGASSSPVTVAFTLVGADEQAADPMPENPEVTFKVNPSVTNSGGNAKSPQGFEFSAAHQAYVTSAFDTNDKLQLTSVSHVEVAFRDVDGDAVADTVLTLEFMQGNQPNTMDLILLGFSDFSTESHLTA